MTIEKIYWWIMVVRMIFIIPKKFYGQVTIECDGNVSPMAFEDDKITIEPLDALVMTEIQKIFEHKVHMLHQDDPQSIITILAVTYIVYVACRTNHIY